MEKSKAKKSYLIVAMLLLLVLVSLGIGFVVAYGNPPYTPSVMGHNFGEIYWECNTTLSATTSASFVVATCPVGYPRLISGGCADGSTTIIIKASTPSPLTYPTGWRCDRTTSGPTTLTAYALCCKA